MAVLARFFCHSTTALFEHLPSVTVTCEPAIAVPSRAFMATSAAYLSSVCRADRDDKSDLRNAGVDW